MSVQRWIIVSDSLALPRESVPYEATWPYLLAKALPQTEWIVLAQRAQTTNRLVTGQRGADALEAYNPTGAIVALGICDCAPRLFKKGGILERLVSRYPDTIGKWIISYKRLFGGRSFKKAWVNPEDFRRNIENYADRCAKLGINLIIVPILAPSDIMLKKSPLIRESIAQYNAILETCATQNAGHALIICGYDIDKAPIFTVEDGYHLSAKGNEFVFKQIYHQLTEIIKSE